MLREQDVVLKEQEDTVGQVAIAAVRSLAPSSSATIHQPVFEEEEEDGEAEVEEPVHLHLRV